MSNLFTLPREVILSNAGALIPGAKAYFYLYGTSTPQDTYTASDLLTANTNPVIADGDGRFPAIYLDSSLRYKVTITDADDVEIYTEDDFQDTLSAADVGAALYPLTAGEMAAGLTVDDITNNYEPGNVRRYGVVGDDATDNATALQTAFTYSASSGYEIYAPEGTYQTSAPMTASARVRLRGAGYQRTIFKDDGSNADFMNASFPVEISGCGFDGYTYAFEFIEATAQTGYSFTDCEFKNGTRGLFADESTSIGLSDFRVKDCRFDTMVDYGIYLEAETLRNITIEGCDFRTIGTTSTATAIRLGGNTVVSDFRNVYKVINNDFKDITTSHATAETHAIILYAGDGVVVVTGNTLENISNGGTTGCEGIYTKARWHTVADNILIDAGKVQGAINIKGRALSESETAPWGYGGVCHDNIVVFRTFTSGVSGISIQNENINCHDNYVEGASLYGIWLSKASGCKVHHNIVYGGGGSDNSNPYKGIYSSGALATDNLEIDNNTVEGSAYTGTGQVVAIDVKNAIATVAENVKVRNNTIKNNTFASGTFRAIQFNASDEDFNDSVITGNDIFEGSVGIQSTGANDLIRTTVANNRIAAAVTTDYSYGASDTFVGDIALETPTALDDTGTPSVIGNTLFVTGGTTAITDFDDGVVGQTIKIRAAHSVTITDNAAIELAGGNYAMTASDTLTLTMYTDQVWTEDARSVN